MKRFTLILIGVLLLSSPAWALKNTRYGERFCSQPEYTCLVTNQNDTWESLFPEPEQQDIVRRLNRMNINLKAGMKIAVPNHLDQITIYDVSPFPRYIKSDGEKSIYVSQEDLAWGAYDEQGELVWWGPLSSGAGGCPSLDGHCLTPSGSFRIIRKQDIDCISTAFPQRPGGVSGGAEMPYCMHFFRGYALHGSDSVPGYRASHGCVRMFIEDARWLNEEFIDLPGGAMKGTRVFIEAPKESL